MNNIFSAEEILQQLKAENFVMTNPEIKSENDNYKKTPWYISMLIGFCAWFATFFILGFIGLIFFQSWKSSPVSFIFLGGVLCGFSIYIANAERNNIFISQLSLAGCIAGEILILIGAGILKENTLFLCGIAILLQSVIFIFYINTIYRFLSAPVIIISVIILLREIQAGYLIHFLPLILGSSIIFLLMFKEKIICGKYPDFFNPVFYGINISFLIFFFITLNNDMSSNLNIKDWRLSTIAVAVVFLFFQKLIVKKAGMAIIDLKVWAIWIFTIILTLITYKSPGIIASIFIITTAFNFRNIAILGISVTFLIIYIIFFYYNMDISLLYKSYILISSGILFLCIQFFLKKRGGESK